MPFVRRTLTAVLLAGTTALATAATAPAAPAAPAATVAPARAAAANGQVVVEWDAFRGKARQFGSALRRSGSIELVAAAVNDRYALQADIPIVFSSGFEVGPAYLQDVPIDGVPVSFIAFPGSFLVEEVSVLRKELRGVRELRPVQAMVYANEFVVAHELGHALVDQLELPITGKEEDAVDGFAAYLLANTEGFGARSALSASILFAGLAHTPSDEDYADEHSLSQQRVYQFLCWIYGSDRKTFKGLVGDGGLPAVRAARCEAEWRQLNRSWSFLLKPHEK